MAAALPMLRRGCRAAADLLYSSAPQARYDLPTPVCGP